MTPGRSDEPDEEYEALEKTLVWVVYLQGWIRGFQQLGVGDPTYEEIISMALRDFKEDREAWDA